METLIWFALWAGLFFLMMRFGCGSHVMGHGHGQHGSKEASPAAGGDGVGWVAPQTEIDPVCRKTVNTEMAKSAIYGGKVYYFCSNEDRDRFEAEPERYVGPQASQQQMEHSHG